MRTCKVGPSVNSRTEKHGDEDVPACDIPIQGMMLTHDELEALVPGAHKAFFAKQRGTDFYDLTDLAKLLRPFKFVDKFEGASATLQLGIDGKEITLDKDVKIAKLVLDPQTGGMTELSITLQTTPTTDVMAEVFAFMNREITADVSFGKKAEAKKKKQPELALDHGAGEQDADDEEEDDGTDVDTDIEDDDETETPPSIGPRTQEELDRLSRLAGGKGRH